jgi:hypothetical protein
VKKFFLLSIFFLFAISLQAQFTSSQSTGNMSGDPSSNPNTGFPTPNRQNADKNAKRKSGREALDDSTRLKYGPHSVYYFLESDVVKGSSIKRRIDTSLTLFQRYLYTEKLGFLYQDLGNQGTALRPLFITSPIELGTQTGYNAYLPYAFQTQDVKYFNTKSPYSDVEYYLGAGGQTRLNFAFARNIDSLWNMGFELQRMVADKVLTDASSKSSDKSLLGQWGIVFHSNYQSKSGKYRLLGHINYFDQGTKDQGGLKETQGLKALDLLKYTDNAAILEDGLTESNDKFIKFHLYHEYIGWKGLQLFQTIDVQSRSMKFKDLAFQTNLSNGFYPKTYINYIQAPDKDSLYNEIQWSEYAHQTGLKGVYKGFNYRAYLKQRYWNAYNPVEDAKKDRLENTIGLVLQQSIGKNIDFTAQGEYLLGSDYLLKAQFETPRFRVQFKNSFYSPHLASTWTYNTSYRWKNDFDNTLSTEIDAEINLGKSSFYFSPGASIQRIAGLMYFDTKGNAAQSNEGIAIFRPRVDVGGKFGKWNWFAKGYLNTQSGPDIFRSPALVFQGNLSVDLQYKKLLYTQIGLDFHHQSEYFAPAYQPALQQYYLQNNLSLPAFTQVDAYLTMRINRVRLFFKFGNALQGLVADNHYTAYLHQSMYQSFGYGVRWLLFD